MAVTIDPYDPLVPDQTILNEIKYAARDFVTMADDILRRMKTEYGTVYNDYTDNAVAIMLRDIVCWAFAHVQWCMDRTASDVYLKTARTASAVSALVEQINYKMTPAVASSGTLKLTFPDGTVSPFEMKDRWKFQGPNGLIFETYAKKLVSPALSAGGTVSVDIRQGETRVSTYTSDGSKNQSFVLSGVAEGKYLAQGATEIWVDGTLWDERDFLEFKTGVEGNIYEINYLASPPLVRFGDGIAGNIPADTAEIKIRYVVIDGKSGNVREDTIVQSIDTLFIGGNPVTFEVTNESRTSGGDDPEDIDRARRVAPRSFAARGAAITKNDYEALSESFFSATYGRPARVYAHSPKTSYSDTVFNALIVDIESVLSTYRGLVDGVELSLLDLVNEMDLLLSSMLVSINALSALQTSMESGVLNAINLGSGARSSALTAYSTASSAEANIDDVVDMIDALKTWVNASGMSASDKNIVINGDVSVDGLEDMRELLLVAKNNTSTASVKANEVISSMDTLLDTHLDGVLNSIQTELPDIITSLTNDRLAMNEKVANPVTGMLGQIDYILGTSLALEIDILALVEQMRTRISEIFSDDCQSNYVQVPILSTDSDGNYVAPSLGLRNALQTYLNSVKEVTQLVEVVDGSSVLVPADIVVELEIYPAYVKAEVESQVRRVISRVLKGRDFEEPLYLSDLYQNIKASSNGIKRVNVEITGPITVPAVIIGGNLVPNDNQIIIEGTVTVNIIE